MADAVTNLIGYSLSELKTFFTQLGEKPYRALQMMKAIHQEGYAAFDAITTLSKSLRERLHTLAIIKAPELHYETTSCDGTRKWLMRLEDGNVIETVFIPEKTRGTLCISSQVGCALNCSFCATATQGFNRNLTASEIIGQVWRAKQRLGQLTDNQTCGLSTKITNVVLMGMGEPLLNMEGIVPALALMRDDNAYGLPRRRVTVSTSGVVNKFLELAQKTDVAFALSLHAPFDDLRNELVPINKKYPIAIVIKACKEYLAISNTEFVTIEYVMLQGVNDSIGHAKGVVKCLQGLKCKINLIPFNPTRGIPYVCSKESDIKAFQKHLMQAGLVATVRKTRGQDVNAACGQLVGSITDRTQRHAKWVAKLVHEECA